MELFLVCVSVFRDRRKLWMLLAAEWASFSGQKENAGCKTKLNYSMSVMWSVNKRKLYFLTFHWCKQLSSAGVSLRRRMEQLSQTYYINRIKTSENISKKQMNTDLIGLLCLQTVWQIFFLNFDWSGKSYDLSRGSWWLFPVYWIILYLYKTQTILTVINCEEVLCTNDHEPLNHAGTVPA